MTASTHAHSARPSRARKDDAAPLAAYRAKRDFGVTSEPRPTRGRSARELAFVIQKHDARRLHYDFRLELDGVLVSWAVPKGPSLDPADKRLAVKVEDHPLAYAGFEGTIPEGQYGAGDVIVWDRGRWAPEGDARAALAAGKLVFRLEGEKLHGLWELVRTRRPGERQEQWLLFKKHDEWERPHREFDVVSALPDSVLARRPPAKVAAKKAPARAKKAPPRPAGAEAARLPATLEPELATTADAPPAHGDWLYEIKFDGYRLLARLDHGEVRIFTRGGHDWTARLRPLADALARLPVDEAWLDGEAVVLDAHGHPSFNRLQNALDAARGEAVSYFAFDLPFAHGMDLRRVPLVERRALLAELLRADEDALVRFSDDFQAPAGEVLRSACSLGLEGVIAKRRDSSYASGRSTDWLKLKCHLRQEFVIGGYSRRRDRPDAVGALALGYYDDAGVLHEAGRVGTGWSADGARELHAKLAPLETARSPFTGRRTVGRGRRPGEAHWVRPELVAEVEFAQWTPDGSVRHASYQGLREDKDARAVVRESASTPPRSAQPEHPAAAPPAPARRKAATADPAAEAEVDGVRISHPERVVDEASGCTKLELARYYASVAEWMLPHLEGRPVSLVRAPAGIAGQHVFQRHADARVLPELKRWPGLWEGHGPLLEVADARALVSAAQMNVVELHTWNSRLRRIAVPDRLVFDLDPGEGVGFAAVREGAELLRALLEELGLRCWLKTSGGKGLHVVVPLLARADCDYEVAKAFSRAVVQHLARTLPERFVATSGPANRVGRIFVDYLRNGFGATTAAAFSVRARPGLGVSMTLSWDELPRVKSGDPWTLATAREHLSFRKADPWDGYARCRQTLTAARKALAAAN